MFKYIWIILYMKIYFNYINLLVFDDLYISDLLSSYLSRIKVIKKFKYSFKNIILLLF